MVDENDVTPAWRSTPRTNVDARTARASAGGVADILLDCCMN